jgi:hypothetical protein
MLNLSWDVADDSLESSRINRWKSALSAKSRLEMIKLPGNLVLEAQASPLWMGDLPDVEGGRRCQIAVLITAGEKMLRAGNLRGKCSVSDATARTFP